MDLKVDFAHKTSWLYSRYPLKTNELNNKRMEKVSLEEEGETKQCRIKLTQAEIHT